MPTTVEKGRRAESAAEDYLLGRGWKLLARNYRTPAGEIDLLCRDGRVVVVVEVKSRSGTAFGEALESIGPRKEQRLRAAAAWWMATHGGWRDGIRFDVVTVDLGENGMLLRLVHLRDVLGVGR